MSEICYGKIVHHRFKPRSVFVDDKPVELNECGYCIDAMLNSPAFDPIYCGKKPEEHTEC
jgi:hypothetical protein